MTRIGIARSQLDFKHNTALPAFKQTQMPNHPAAAAPTRPVTQPVRFQGKHSETSSNRQATNKTRAPKTPPIIHKLFDQPRKNMMWSLGYSVGGVMLLPMPPVATGAFCLALVHLVSASYQFLKQKPEPPASPASSSTS